MPHHRLNLMRSLALTLCLWTVVVAAADETAAAKPESADKTILCGITNLLLTPAEYSQM